MNTTLVSLMGSPDIPLNRPILVIGRHVDCDVVIESKKVSRQHCCIASLQTKLIVRDLGSTNGIRVNGKRHEESVLYAGDELTIGNLRFRVDSTNYKAPPSVKRPSVPLSDNEIESSDVPVVLEDDEEDGMGTELASPDAMLAEPSKQSINSSWLRIPDEVHLEPSSDADIIPLAQYEDNDDDD